MHYLIHCGICTKQEIELMSCDLTSCYLPQFLTDIRWGKTSKNQEKNNKSKKKQKIKIVWLLAHLIQSSLLYLIHCAICTKQEMSTSSVFHWALLRLDVWITYELIKKSKKDFDSSNFHFPVYSMKLCPGKRCPASVKPHSLTHRPTHMCTALCK